MSSSNFQEIIDMPMEEYLDFLRIPYEDIKAATHNFTEANLITQGTSCKVYKGQLLHSGHLINVVVREFLQLHVANNELRICKYLSHKNISSTFKIGDKRTTIVNKHEANGSLDKHLSGSTLTWMQRLKICLGVAHALCYIHLGLKEDYSIIHGNIKSSKILLDRKWEPKLHGFGYATRVKRNQGHLTSNYNGTLQYMDPAYENTKTLTYKSDVFSFGVVLFEVLFGTKASIENGDHWYFARLARLHYEKKTLDQRIDPGLRQQMDLQSLKILSETAYCCLKEFQAQRPSMDQIVIKLETAIELQQKYQTLEPEKERQQKHRTPFHQKLLSPFQQKFRTPFQPPPPKKSNPFVLSMIKEHSTPADEGTSSGNLKGKNLDHLKILWTDIELATNSFSKNKIGQGTFGVVYKGELDHFDGKNLPEMNGRNKGKFPKRRSTVAIKRLISRVDTQGFFAEIDLLSKCKHPNIVSLLGFCEDNREQILVYEYVSNGSLSNYLGNINNMTNLTWDQRIQICLDIANGLNYLHTSTQEKQMIVHRDIKSDNILLDNNWMAKISDFGLSRLRPTNQINETLKTGTIAGTKVYLDPEYSETGKLRKEIDIYSLGVVLFEIMCGRIAYDDIYYANNDDGLPSTIHRCYDEKTLKELVDPKLKEANKNTFMLNGGLNQDSLDIFIDIAYQCLAKTHAKRPTTKVIIKELHKALYFQQNSKDKLQISLRDIKIATQNFREEKCIGKGRYWKQYKGNITWRTVEVVVKRFDSKSDKGKSQFITELKVLLEHKHDNIVALIGYCIEMDEKIIVYEHASNGSLDKHLNNSSLKWMKRLKICIDVAGRLAFFHKENMIHRDIKSANIVLDGVWKAKISNLEMTGYWEHGDFEHDTGSLDYVDPLYKNQGHLNEASDIYSLGVVLIEILSGRLARVFNMSVGDLVRKCERSVEAFDEYVFTDIKQHSSPESLATFFKIACKCLELDNRPNASEVLIQLNKALELQEDYEIWEPKLPKDYREIILMSSTPEIYSNESKKNLYDMLTTKGIPLQQGKLWFVLGGNGERNVMISATNFSYKNHSKRKWKSIPESRFEKVARILDISTLKIQIKIKPQLLYPDVNYGVHLVFSFGRPIKSIAKWIYVNLKYKMPDGYLCVDFARRREDGWMTIELCRFLNHKKDTELEILLESFSRCYCESRVYVEGVEFLPIDNASLKTTTVKSKEIKNQKDVQQSSVDCREIYSNDELFSLTEVNKKIHLIVSPVVLYDCLKRKRFPVKRSDESRFHVVIELPRQQVFSIKFKIRSRLLSPDTDYACYLVFKLSEKCCGLHCPVRVRNVLQWKNKEIGLVCFRPPSPMTLLHDTICLPEEREDGWMEVIVWKFNSTSGIRNDGIPMNLKLITYEGNMSGLIVSVLEIRSI